MTQRLTSVLGVIYLIFNEGYSATSGDDLIRRDLCLEALRLGRLLAELAPDESEVHGLVALMEIQASRSAARTSPSGEPIPLEDQNRGRWDPLLIRRGFAAMLRAREIGATPGPYLLQGAIAVCHAQARTAEETDWAQIAALYDALVRLLPTPVVRLNRAVAIGRAFGPSAGLVLADSLVDDPQLRNYHFLPSVRGDFLFRLGRGEEARLEFLRGAALARNASERAYLHRRAGVIPIAESAGPTLGQVAHAFLGRDDLDAATKRSYGQTLRRLCLALGEQATVDSVTADRVARVFEAAWAATAAKTWNRHRSAIRSFSAWAVLDDLAAGLDRRPETDPGLAPIGPAQIEELWQRTDVALRERTLWCLLYESGAPVKAVLSLNVEDLDLADRRAHTSARRIGWRAASARLLAELVVGRSQGPVFLTDRVPGPGGQPADADRCPITGRRRLSYERAEYLFKQATKSVDPAGRGYTLRQLKQARL
jgi:Phage integrase, N-terminal SAM-like domain